MPVVGELELAWRLLPNRFVAVTGTNGKTTTVELLGAIWRAAGLPVAVAGNVGTPLSALVGEVDPAATIVCEVSSFQAEDAVEFAPDIGLLLNLTPDHLDRHGTFEAYREAKLRLFARQTPEQVAIAPDWIELPGDGRRVPIGELPLPPAEIRLRGAHNLENAMGATAVARAAGVAPEAVAEALRSFAGVPHRLEEVGTVDGVLYVNDSKATNVSSAAARDRVLRGRRARDPRRQPQGGRLRGPARAGRGALPRLLPDRRGGRAAGRRPRRRRRPAAPLR